MCECCKTLSYTYLQILNSLVGTIGIGLIIYASLLISELDTDYDEVVNDFFLYGPLGFGITLVLLSFIGCFGVQGENKCMLLIYFILTLMATFVVLGTGIALLVFSGELDDVENANVQEGSSGVVERVTDFELAVYQRCCNEVNNFNVQPPELCESNANLEVCITDEERFDDFVDSIGESICDALEEVDINDVPVVGDPAEGGCGGGDPVVFVESVTEYLIDNIRPLGAFTLALSLILVLDVFATCVLLWSKRDKDVLKK